MWWLGLKEVLMVVGRTTLSEQLLLVGLEKAGEMVVGRLISTNDEGPGSFR